MRVIVLVLTISLMAAGWSPMGAAAPDTPSFTQLRTTVLNAGYNPRLPALPAQAGEASNYDVVFCNGELIENVMELVTLIDAKHPEYRLWARQRADLLVHSDETCDVNGPPLQSNAVFEEAYTLYLAAGHPVLAAEVAKRASDAAADVYLMGYDNTFYTDGPHGGNQLAPEAYRAYLSWQKRLNVDVLRSVQSLRTRGRELLREYRHRERSRDAFGSVVRRLRSWISSGYPTPPV